MGHFAFLILIMTASVLLGVFWSPLLAMPPMLVWLLVIAYLEIREHERFDERIEIAQCQRDAGTVGVASAKEGERSSSSG